MHGAQLSRPGSHPRPAGSTGNPARPPGHMPSHIPQHHAEPLEDRPQVDTPAEDTCFQVATPGGLTTAAGCRTSEVEDVKFSPRAPNSFLPANRQYGVTPLNRERAYGIWPFSAPRPSAVGRTPAPGRAVGGNSTCVIASGRHLRPVCDAQRGDCGDRRECSADCPRPQLPVCIRPCTPPQLVSALSHAARARVLFSHSPCNHASLEE